MKDGLTGSDPDSHLCRRTVGLHAVPNLPLVQPGDEVGQMIVDHATANGFAFQDGDVVVVTHNITSLRA
jgi:coenzyme F420-0:L-glutamate ligase/coenzyme F420-1:gamma-L-glutamate ligase